MNHSISSEHVRHRWSKEYPPAIVVGSGDRVLFDCRDSSDGQIHRDSSLCDIETLNGDRIHAITGPVYVDGSKAGDVLEVRILSIEHDGWAWTGVRPGMGFLPQRFDQAHLVIWELQGEVSNALPPASVPLDPFPGIIGLASDVDGEHRTRPPGPFGGNMDVRECRVGSKVFLPVQVAGALLSIGDVHAAQGDGEVCLCGMEMPARVEVELVLHRDWVLPSPMVEAAAPKTDRYAGGSWVMVECDQDPLIAARRAVGRMVDMIADRFDLAPYDAYVLCSVAMDLKLSQVVNNPVYTVSAAMPKSTFPSVF